MARQSSTLGDDDTGSRRPRDGRRLPYQRPTPAT